MKYRPHNWSQYNLALIQPGSLLLWVSGGRSAHGMTMHIRARDDEIAELTDVDRVRLANDGQRRVIEINPALLRDEHGVA
jgi:hypothetical protein